LATEIELKLRIVEVHDQDVLLEITKCLALLGLASSFQVNELKNVYFDTADWQLNAQKIALRVRKNGECYIQTLKTKGQSVNGLSRRGEWEWNISEPKLAVPYLKQCEAWPSSVNPEALMVVFETNFIRHQIELEWQGAIIELAFDQGEILSKGHIEKINEIELELLSGNENGLHLLYGKLQTNLSLEPSDISKAERGYRLFHQ